MSNYNISDNPFLETQMLEKYIQIEEDSKKNPQSVLYNFKQELLDLGFEFQVLNQAERLLPKNKKTILPIAIRYYKEAQIASEKKYLLKWFYHKGFEEVVPILLDDYFSEKNNVDRWAIGDCLYQIRSRSFIKEYLSIISNSEYGYERQMVICLLGKLKESMSIPVLIELLEDESVRLHVICALAEFKKEEFRCFFERFQDSTHPGWKKYARLALKKLDSSKKE